MHSKGAYFFSSPFYVELKHSALVGDTYLIITYFRDLRNFEKLKSREKKVPRKLKTRNLVTFIKFLFKFSVC